MTARSPFERLMAALCEPRRLDPGVDAVERVETHISVVLLAGDHAWKFKKPLDLGFLDFGTLEKRRRACEEELRLNRRTAPAIYLDVVPVGGTADEPRVGVEPAIEYAVRMRRFDQDCLLDRIAARGALTADLLETLARDLAAFHDRAAAADRASPWGTPEQVLAPALENFAQLDKLVEDARDRATLVRLRQWTECEHARRRDAFAERRAAGRIREAHGDLHLGNVVLLDGRATPFDCIEFNPALRWIDVMSEIAFLVMDLVDHGLAPLAARFLDAYLAATGDYDGIAVLRFYAVYRAMVRAKIACIRAHQPGVDVHGRTRADAQYHGYLALAERLAAARRPMLVLMHGLSGSGKSRTAQALVERLDAIRLRSDVERKRLHGLAPSERSNAALDAGLYTQEATRRTYDRLAALAGMLLEAGRVTIVDAAFLRRDEREAFRALAERREVPFAIVSCTAPESVLRDRIERRSAAGADPSEATLAVLERQITTEEPLTPEERPHAIVIDTTAGDASRDALLDALARR